MIAVEVSHVPKLSAGLLVHRSMSGGDIEVLLVHPGGPFWAHKDQHAWSIPKGEHEPSEDAYVVARREFEEELGQPAPEGTYVFLGEVRQSGAKRVSAWAVEADLDVSTVVSNSFEMEWPRGSGRVQTFPEVDRAAWCSLAEARERLIVGQVPLLDELLSRLMTGPSD